MPPSPLVDLKKLNMEKVLYDADAICEVIPHRYGILSDELRLKLQTRW